MLSPVVRYGHLSCHWDVRPCSDWEDHIEPFPVACLQDNSLDVSSLVLIPSREARNVDWFEPNTRHAGKSRNLMYESDVHALTPVIYLLSEFISDVFPFDVETMMLLSSKTSWFRGDWLGFLKPFTYLVMCVMCFHFFQMSSSQDGDL